MPDTKISAFPAAGNLDGTEQIAAVQTGADVAITPAQILTYATSNANTWDYLQTFSSGISVVEGASVDTIVGASAAFNYIATSSAALIGGKITGSSNFSLTGSASVGSIQSASANFNYLTTSSNALISGTITGSTKITAGSSDILLYASKTLTDNSSTQAATILNGPVVGNPTKWIAINDGGQVRYIPAW